jgi:anti-sigma28 factor (negative regulator of flagellin synthesis)
MKIENDGLKRLYQIETGGSRHVEKSPSGDDRTGNPNALGGKDQAILSEDALMLAKAFRALGDVPETRADLVKGLREQIENGKYQVAYEEIVKQLLLKLPPQD